MPELPWFKCFGQDMLSDPCVKCCEPATRGIWTFAWFTMQLSGTYMLEGTVSDLARICCVSDQQMAAAIADLKRTKTGDVIEQNGNTILICRRLQREHGIKELRSKAGKASATKRQQGVPTPSAYASASASVSNPEGECEGKQESVHVTSARVLIYYLNEKAGRAYRETSKNFGFITARLSEPGVTLEGCKTMIDRQVRIWKGTEKDTYLRPETLFNETKFDGYYGAKDSPVIRTEPSNGSGQPKPPLRNAI